MKYHLDAKLRTHYMWFDGPIDLIDATAKKVREMEANGTLPDSFVYYKDQYVGTSWKERTGRGWDTLRGFLNTPWPHAMRLIEKVVEEVRTAPLPDPKDTRRKMKWSDDAGEVDVYRAMDGEAEYMRKPVRTRVSAPPHVTLLCNLDRTYNSGCNESGVWYRSAVGMAVADKLEGLGYGVDIVVYCLGKRVYPYPNDVQLVACRPKRAGDPVDFTALCDTMSEWFTSKAFFASFLTCPTPPVSVGAAWQPGHDETDPWATQMAPWLRLLDLEVGTIPVLVPMATGAGSPTTCAQKVLERVRSLTG